MLERAKRHFTDLRYGYLIVVPLITYSNFILIAYNFTPVRDWMGVEIFTVVFTAGMVSLLVFLGRIFRKQQLGTDEDLKYEQARQQAKTLRILLESQYGINPSEEMRHRIIYLRDIETGNTKRTGISLRRPVITVRLLLKAETAMLLCIAGALFVTDHYVLSLVMWGAAFATLMVYAWHFGSIKNNKSPGRAPESCTSPSALSKSPESTAITQETYSRASSAISRRTADDSYLL